MEDLLWLIFKGIIKGLAFSAIVLLCFLFFDWQIAIAISVNMIFAFFPIMCIKTLVQNVRILKRGVRAEGTVTGSAVCGKDRLAVIVWNTPNGEMSREFDYSTDFFGNAKVGTTVTVVYIPDDPGNACIEKYSLRRSMIFTAFFVGLSLCILFMTFLALRC